MSKLEAALRETVEDLVTNMDLSEDIGEAVREAMHDEHISDQVQEAMDEMDIDEKVDDVLQRFLPSMQDEMQKEVQNSVTAQMKKLVEEELHSFLTSPAGRDLLLYSVTQAALDASQQKVTSMHQVIMDLPGKLKAKFMGLFAK